MPSRGRQIAGVVFLLLGAVTFLIAAVGPTPPIDLLAWMVMLAIVTGMLWIAGWSLVRAR